MAEKTRFKTGDVTRCPRCKGKGEVRDSFDYWIAPFTLGASLFWGKIECGLCNGKGFIRIVFRQ